MSRYRFAPACHCLASSRPGGDVVRPGDEVDIADDWADLIRASYPGIDGQPCLIPLDPIERVLPPESGASLPSATPPPPPPVHPAGRKPGRGR